MLRFSHVRLLLICALICQTTLIAEARTRYEQFDVNPETNLPFCDPKGRLPLDDRICREFCESSSYATGGCDCKTLKCVCADMFLDFCDFNRIRVFI